MKMRHLLAIIPLLLFIINLNIGLNAQEANSHPIPQWLLDNWAAQVEGTGVWVTDNSAYKNEQEPFDAYGMKWEWGLGKKHLKGSLYCIKGGEDVGTVWQFLSFWDPAKGEVRMIQIGSDGTVGEGKMAQQEDGSTKSQEKFTSPDGGSFESGHHTWMENGKMHTQSFNIVDGEWSKRRYYVWKLENG